VGYTFGGKTGSALGVGKNAFNPGPGQYNPDGTSVGLSKKFANNSTFGSQKRL
jgi:hypothetical protein